MVETLRPLPAAEAVRILAGDAAADLAGDALNADTVVAVLRGSGVRGRSIFPPGGDLPLLRTPSILGVTAGWILVEAHAGKRLRIRDAAGSREVALETIAAESRGVAVEILEGEITPSVTRSLFALVPRGALGTWLAATLIAEGLGVAVLLLTRAAVDRAVPDRAPSLLVLLCIGVAAAALFQGFGTWLRARALLAIENRVETAAVAAMFDHVMNLPFSWFQRKTFGQVMQAFTGLSAARDVAAAHTASAAVSAVAILLSTIVLLALLPAAAATVLAGAVLVGISGFASGSVQLRHRRDEVVARTARQSYLLELISAVEPVKSAAAEERLGERWTRIFRLESAAALARMRAGTWADVLTDVFRGLAVGVLLVWGASAAVQGTITIGSFLLLMQAGNWLFVSVLGLTAAWMAYAVSRPDVARAAEVLATPQEERRAPAVLASRSPQRVVLDGVWFRYDEDGPWVLSDRSLLLRDGEKLRLDAPSGAGKTTLLRLVAGFVAPSRGMVRVDGRDPRRGGLALRYLPQFVHLYGGSIMQNLEVLSGNAPRALLLRAAEETGLAELIETLPMRYDTLVTPGAKSFSGGQRQLMALTAMAASGATLLVLDEPMSNIDLSSQARATRSPLLAEKTILYASHSDAGFV